MPVSHPIAYLTIDYSLGTYAHVILGEPYGGINIDIINVPQDITVPADLTVIFENQTQSLSPGPIWIPEVNLDNVSDYAIGLGDTVIYKLYSTDGGISWYGTMITPNSSRYVRITGDTMTGQLNQMVDGIVNNITYGQGPGGTGNHSNTVFGWSAMLNNTTGDRNTVFGSSAMAMNTTGFGNVAVGANAGTNITSGANNVMIGYNAGNDAVASISSQSNYVVIGNNSTTNANIKVSWTVTSDARDKTDIQPIGVGLEFVNQLKPKQFKLMDRETQQATTGVRYGFLAQDVLESEGATPIIVDVTDADNLKMHESMVVPVLVKAVQDLSAKLDAALSKIAALEAK